MARPGALGAPSRGRCGAALAQGGWARFDPGDVPPPPTTDGPMCGSVLFIMKEHSCDDGGEARTAGRGRTRRRAAEAAAHAARAVLWGASGRPEPLEAPGGIRGGGWGAALGQGGRPFPRGGGVLLGEEIVHDVDGGSLT